MGAAERSWLASFCFRDVECLDRVAVLHAICASFESEKEFDANVREELLKGLVQSKVQEQTRMMRVAIAALDLPNAR